LTCEDAFAVLTLIRGPADDPFDRQEGPEDNANRTGKHLRYGVVRADQRQFFSDSYAEDNYTQAIGRLQAIGGTIVEIDFAPFAEAGRMMFDGPWVAERLHAVGDYVRSHVDSVLPVTRKIILGADRYSAADAFAAEYRLRTLKQQTRDIFADIDALVVPTVATIPTVAEVAEDPISRNTRMGAYSYFVNLLDLAACAVPNGLRPDGLPGGVTFIAPALSDSFLVRIGSTFHQSVGGSLGKTRHLLPTSQHQCFVTTASEEEVHI
jgi:allophanate hydrolase